jgi:hypothetical protein
LPASSNASGRQKHPVALGDGVGVLAGVLALLQAGATAEEDLGIPAVLRGERQEGGTCTERVADADRVGKVGQALLLVVLGLCT